MRGGKKRGMDVRRMGWQGRDGVGWKGGGGSAVPLGLIVEARLNGAGAGKVSVQRGQQRGGSITVAWKDDT